MVMPNITTAVVGAVFNPEGSIHLAETSPHRHGRLVRLEQTSLSVLPAGHVEGRGLSAPILASAAIALTGSSGAKRPASRQARSEAHKVLKHWPSSSSDIGFARSSRPALMGAVLQLVARAFTAVGLIMHRAGLNDERMVVLWRVGLGTYMAAAIPDVLSYLLAPQAVLTVLSPVEPLLVSVLAALLLPQDSLLLTSKHSLATALCVAGTLGCVLFSPAASAFGAGATGGGKAAMIWDAPSGAERLFQPAGARRLTVYLFIVVPSLIYLARQVYKKKIMMNHPLCPFSEGRLRLPLVAAMSLALQRLALGMLGVSLGAVHWEMRSALQSPAVYCTIGLIAVCMLSCGYHVCQGMTETPPHIFVPLYCTMSTLIQLFQSIAIMRDFRDDPTERFLLTLACAAASASGVLWLSTTKCQKGMTFAGSWVGLPGSRPHVLNCLEPVMMQG